MLKVLKAIVFTVTVSALSFSALAVKTQPGVKQDIRFAAYCEDAQDILSALSADADFITLGAELGVEQADRLIKGEASIIVDAQSLEDAEEKYEAVRALSPVSKVYFRVDESAGKVTKWAQAKEDKPELIGSYTGNIYFAALSCINRFGKYGENTAVQLRTGNQDGVILHDTVTFMFDKTDTVGMFSFVNTQKSAKRTDSARSWDDLIARGYSIIETVYPEDFAEYLSKNTAARSKLEESVNASLAVSTQGCKPNRVSAYEQALETAQLLLEDGSSAEYMMSDARAQLDEAVANIGVDDGSKVQGDFRITPARAAWALFGIALVLSWQIYFRKHWGKKENTK